MTFAELRFLLKSLSVPYRVAGLRKASVQLTRGAFPVSRCQYPNFLRGFSVLKGFLRVLPAAV